MNVHAYKWWGVNYGINWVIKQLNPFKKKSICIDILEWVVWEIGFIGTWVRGEKLVIGILLVWRLAVHV